MNKSLDAIIAELHEFLEKGDSDPIWEYLGQLDTQLQELAGQRPTVEEMKSAIGQGIHKGMRVQGAMTAYRAVDKLDDKDWDNILDYAVYCLKTMNMVSLRKEEKEQ